MVSAAGWPGADAGETETCGAGWLGALKRKNLKRGRKHRAEERTGRVGVLPGVENPKTGPKTVGTWVSI